MTMKGQTLLTGHTLFEEGRAVVHPDCTVCRGLSWQARRRKGHAKCSCGALSEHLTSGYQRKRWHREHKDEIRAAAKQP